MGKNNFNGFQHQRNPDKTAFIKVSNKLYDTERRTIYHITSERTTRQSSQEMKNILDVVEDKPGTNLQCRNPQTIVINKQ